MKDGKNNPLFEGLDGLLTAVKREYDSLLLQLPVIKEKFKHLDQTNEELGLKYMNAGNYGDAIVRFKIALFLRPDDNNLLYNIGYCYLQKGRPVKASGYFKKALISSPDLDDIKYMLALCGVAKISKIPDDLVITYYRNFAADYERTFLEDFNYRGHVLLLDSLLRHASDIAYPAPILDIGCGTGLLGELLRGYAAPLHGIDLTPEMLSTAAGKMRDEKPLYDGLALANLEESLVNTKQKYRIITAAYSLQHNGDLSGIFKGVMSALEPGGVFAFSLEKSQPGSDYELRTTRFAHSADYITRLAHDAGFKITAMEEMEILNGFKGFQCLLRS